MSIAENTRMKGMEADIKRLFQMLEESREEQNAERAWIAETTELKFDAIQNSIAQLLDKHQYGSNSGSDYDSHHRQQQHTRKVHFDLPKFDGSDALGWIFALDQYFDFCRIPDEESD